MKRITRQFFCVSLLLLGTAMFANCEEKQEQTQGVEQNKASMVKELFTAIDKGDREAIQKLIAAEVDVNAKNRQGRTAVLEAVRQGETAIAILLIEAGANVNTQETNLDSAFLYAGAVGDLDVVKASVAHGADFTVFNRYGGTALIPAAEKGHVEVVKFLVNTPGFPKDHVNRLGWTALMEAVVLGTGGAAHTTTVEELIKGGADVNIPDKDKVTALTHARRMGFKNIVKLLEAAGAK